MGEAEGNGTCTTIVPDGFEVDEAIAELEEDDDAVADTDRLAVKVTVGEAEGEINEEDEDDGVNVGEAVCITESEGRGVSDEWLGDAVKVTEKVADGEVELVGDTDDEVNVGDAVGEAGKDVDEDAVAETEAETDGEGETKLDGEKEMRSWRDADGVADTERMADDSIDIELTGVGVCVGERDGFLRRPLGVRDGRNVINGVTVGFGERRGGRGVLWGRRRDLVCVGIGDRNAELGNGNVRDGIDGAEIITDGVVVGDRDRKTPSLWTSLSTTSELGCGKASSGSVDWNSSKGKSSSFESTGDFRGRGPTSLGEGNGDWRLRRFSFEACLRIKRLDMKSRFGNCTKRLFSSARIDDCSFFGCEYA